MYWKIWKIYVEMFSKHSELRIRLEHLYQNSTQEFLPSCWKIFFSVSSDIETKCVRKLEVLFHKPQLASAVMPGPHQVLDTLHMLINYTICVMTNLPHYAEYQAIISYS